MSAERAEDFVYDTSLDMVENTAYCVINKHNIVDSTIATSVPDRSYNVETSKKEDTPMTKKCIIVLTCLMPFLIGISLIIVASVILVQIAHLRSDVVLQSTLLTTLANNNTAPVMMLNAEITKLVLDAAANLSSLNNEITVNNLNISDSLSIQLSLLISQTTVNTDILATLLIVFASCAAIQQRLPSSPSGYYHVWSSNGSAVSVYCDMTTSCGNITGGWMRVAQLNMTDNITQCPSDLKLLTSPRRTCLIRMSEPGCSSDTFPVGGVWYSKVCGRIRAYQIGTLDAFGNRQNKSIDDHTYVDGVSLTHGASPRQHIWTFAGANNEDDDVPKHKCRCINTNISSSVQLPPSFVGNDYFCDTAAKKGSDLMFHAGNPLWDGDGCGPQNTCCSFNTPPWFYKQLPQPTADDIEMRVCHDEERANEDIAIEVVEIYVQ